MTKLGKLGNGVLLSDILKNIYCWSSYVFGVLLSLGFYCRVNIHFLKIFKKLGFYCRWSSSVFGVLLSLEFYGLLTLLSLEFYGLHTKLCTSTQSSLKYGVYYYVEHLISRETEKSAKKYGLQRQHQLAACTSIIYGNL